MKHFLFVVALVAGMIPMAGSATATTIPKAYPGKDGLIAFARANQIYTISPDGSGLKKLTRYGKNSNPVWNPAGTEIAYEHKDYTGAQNIWVMRANGSHKSQWTVTGSTYGSPAWSPSGKTLLFTTGGQWGALETASGTQPGQPSHPLYGYDEDPGRPHHALTLLQGNNPSWTKGKIAFTGSNQYGTGAMCDYPGGSSVMEPSCIEVYNTKTKTFSYPGGLVAYYCEVGGGPYNTLDWARWAPDGSNLLFEYQTSDSNCNLLPWAVSTLYNPTPATQPGDRQADYSPDGAYIVLVNAAIGQQAYIIIESSTGSNRSTLTQGYQPNWQPVH